MGLPTRRKRSSRMPRWSLRTRLTAISAVVITLGLSSAAYLLAWRLNAGLVANLDDGLRQQVSDLAVVAGQGRLATTRLGSADGSTLIQVIDVSGRVVANSSNIDGEPRLFTFAVAGARPVLQVGADSADEPGGYRAVGIGAPTPTGPVTIYAARPTADIAQINRDLSAALWVGIPLLILLLAWVAWLLVGRSLRPVEASAAQQRQFLADAAHELRSPVAALQAQLEVRAARPDAAPTQHELRVLAADAGRLGSLVDALLSLARLDAHPDLLRQPVDLDDLIFDAIRRARSMLDGRIESRGVSGAQVRGDRVALERVVQNLLDNAVRHASHTVTVNLRVVDDVAELSVADDGPGIPEADRQRVFARFTRLDSSRSRDDGGAGLGLAIVQEVVAAHSGTVRIDDNAPGARVTVRLPVTGFG